MPLGFGELWFEDAAARDHAMESPEMAAAFADGEPWGDQEKSYGLVEEKTIIG
ncbi:MAG: hypothetical protein QGF21_12605 [Vicinamibacterales bacterium]|jgi:hypothetical protein|nr:hypothetical protein [Vicinamibacterales bacterium]|tara:strand:- start:809 stop:967 length:159 start_codon:yes stop_codon:yes gene_type:complete